MSVPTVLNQKQVPTPQPEMVVAPMSTALAGGATNEALVKETYNQLRKMWKGPKPPKFLNILAAYIVGSLVTIYEAGKNGNEHPEIGIADMASTMMHLIIQGVENEFRKTNSSNDG
jgi:hypothetical protein